MTTVEVWIVAIFGWAIVAGIFTAVLIFKCLLRLADVADNHRSRLEKLENHLTNEVPATWALEEEEDDA